MKSFPMFLQMAGRRVVIAGGGEQAAQKVRLVLKTEAALQVLAMDLDEELAALAEAGRINHISAPVTPRHFEDTALVFIATGCPAADACLHMLAKAAGATVNVVDQPALCDAITPSIVDRDPVVVAIGTEGTAPVLARQIKTRIEEQLEPRLGDLAALAGRLRAFAAARLGPRARRDLWRWVFNDTPRKLHAQGAERDAAKRIKQAILTGDFDHATGGSVALVGAGPGARDLITLRGVQRLQEADIVFYDRLIDEDILELARRDAERVYVGKKPGCHSWPQTKINAVLVSAAQRGLRVVRLKCGDPGIFARGAEEIDALSAAGIPFEVVPGVTAASAAAAAAQTVLTQRGEIDALTLTTGRLIAGPQAPACLAALRPGSCVALYMSVSSAPLIASVLARSPHRAAIDITVVAHAQRADQKVLIACVETLVATLHRHQITDTTMILVKLPKSACAGHAPAVADLLHA